MHAFNLTLLRKLPKRVQCDIALLDGRFWWDWKIAKLRIRRKIARDDPRIAHLIKCINAHVKHQSQNMHDVERNACNIICILFAVVLYKHFHDFNSNKNFGSEIYLSKVCFSNSPNMTYCCNSTIRHKSAISYWRIFWKCLWVSFCYSCVFAILTIVIGYFALQYFSIIYAFITHMIINVMIIRCISSHSLLFYNTYCYIACEFDQWTIYRPLTNSIIY